MKLSRRHGLFLLGSMALLALMWEPIRALITYALTDSKNATQIFLIPVVSGTLIFLDRKNIFRQVRFGVLPGALLMAGGVGLWVAFRKWGAQLVDTDQVALTTLSILFLWLAGFLFLYGSTAFKTALFPLLFLVFCVPVPSAIMNPLIAFLRAGSADIAFVLLRMVGTPVFREGFVFSLPRLSVEIAPECSGIRSFISMLILTVLAGNLVLVSWWRRIAIVVVAIPIMIFKNALRIGTLTLLTIHWDSTILQSRLHQEGGIPFFAVALVLLYPILMLLVRRERRELVA